MNFTMSEKQLYWRDRVVEFMDEHVYPAVPIYDAQMDGFGANRWQVVPVLEELKAKAKKAGLWNLFLPGRFAARGQPLPRRRPDQPGIRALRRRDGQGRLRLRGLQLLGARHRQHGSAGALRQ